jgi:ATP-dependent helicase YprA (DUF1998 family)
MTRHETQTRCSEILITNYSMLEYMLMRPIERPLFQQTRAWHHADPANELIIVLDEAHMYRGAGGAEVALLLRRLLSRLDIPRERVRFILTSASLGTDEEATRAVTQFGRDLTGLSDNSTREFEVVRGTREARVGHSLRRLMAQRRIKGAVLNDYILRRNLSDEHQLIRSLFN